MPAPPPPPPPPTSPPDSALAPPADPLGPAPQPALGVPFRPPAPIVYTTSTGMQVWLLERHTVPLVAVTVTIPSGSSSDPKGEAGLAEETAEMLTEGGGKRGALEFGQAVDDLGARVSASASVDASYVRLNVVKRSFGPAMQLLGDAIVRPRMEASEWKRLHDLWMNDLEARASDPDEVESCVESTALYGADHPYAHPVDGFLASAAKVQLEDVRRFHAQAWRPDRAIVVAVGDVTRSELDAQLEAAFGGWKTPSAPPLPVVTPPPPVADAAGQGGSGGAKPRIVLVDRADAAQAYVYAVRPGVTASDARYPALYRANIAVGGGFTSRINEDLRVKHGWTYGAHSILSARRGVGKLVAGAPFVTANAVEALGLLLADIDDLAQHGMTEDEATKTRMQLRKEYVADYETVEQAAAQLAHDAALGLPPDYEAKASVTSDQADLPQLNELLKSFYGHFGTLVVIVGPRTKLEGPLAQAGYGPIEIVDAEGNAVHKPQAAPAPSSSSPPKAAK